MTAEFVNMACEAGGIKKVVKQPIDFVGDVDLFDMDRITAMKMYNALRAARSAATAVWNIASEREKVRVAVASLLEERRTEHVRFIPTHEVIVSAEGYEGGCQMLVRVTTTYARPKASYWCILFLGNHPRKDAVVVSIP